MTWGAPLLLLLGGLCLQPARAGSHSLRYFYSSLSGPLPGIPQFSSFGYLDDVPIVSYTSGSFREETRAPWMESITVKDPQYWQLQTDICRREEQGFKTKLWKMMEEVNQTRRLYMFQRMFGCELGEDGSIRGFDQYAVDGEDFISFDKDRLTYTAAMDVAKITQDRWNSEKNPAQYWKGYLEGRCIEDLKKYLNLGEERLQRVAPQTMVSRRKNGDRTFLTGYAYGFYPRDIEVRWVRNGVEMPWESRMILPNPDGTYQARATMEVQEGDNEKMYRYEVYHSSLPNTVTVMYEEKSPPIWVIIGGVIGALLGVGLIAAVVWFVYSKINMPGPRPEGGDVKQPLQQGENI